MIINCNLFFGHYYSDFLENGVLLGETSISHESVLNKKEDGLIWIKFAVDDNT